MRTRSTSCACWRSRVACRRTSSDDWSGALDRRRASAQSADDDGDARAAGQAWPMLVGLHDEELAKNYTVVACADVGSLFVLVVCRRCRVFGGVVVCGVWCVVCGACSCGLCGLYAVWCAVCCRSTCSTTASTSKWKSTSPARSGASRSAAAAAPPPLQLKRVLNSLLCNHPYLNYFQVCVCVCVCVC